MIDNWNKDYPSFQEINEESLDENHSLKKMLRLVGENKRVIDFGCATGYFSQLLTKKGCSVVGVEINPDAAKVAELYCEKVIVADLDFVSLTEILPEQKFDVAVFGDVLEHLRNPWAVLKEAQQLLKPDGYIVASIPNIAHGTIRLALLQGKFDYTELGLLDYTHLRFFTRKSVEDMFERSGYLIGCVERTTVPVLANSPLLPQIDQNHLDTQVVQEIAKDEEAETFQFIIRAFPLSLEGKYAALSEKYSQLNQKLERSHLEVQHYQAQLEQTQAQLEQANSQAQHYQADLEQANSQVQHYQADLEQTTNQLQQAEAGWEKTQNQLQQTQTGLEQTIDKLQQTQESWEKNIHQLKQTQTQLQQTQTQLKQTTDKLQQAQLDTQNYQHQLQQAQIDRERAQTRIKAMESSKFWQLRRAWFVARRTAGVKGD